MSSRCSTASRGTRWPRRGTSIAQTGLPTAADDSGLVVPALGGLPGVKSKRWSGRPDLTGRALDDENNRLLLERLRASGIDDRRAYYVCAAAYVDRRARGRVPRRGARPDHRRCRAAMRVSATTRTLPPTSLADGRSVRQVERRRSGQPPGARVQLVARRHRRASRASVEVRASQLIPPSAIGTL